MPSLDHYWPSNEPYQAAGTTVEWTWPMGEHQHYWGFAVRPFQANCTFELVRHWTSVANGVDLHTEHLLVTAIAGGGLIRLSAIRVVGS